MYFHLRTEVERKDPFKNYVVKRILCPTCSKLQIKKIFKNNFYTKYRCWNKNCMNKDIPFVLINDYLKNESTFNGKCELCNQEYYREFIEIKEFFGKLIFKCTNDKCDESNYELSYDLENKEWIKRDILSDCEFHYIHWYLYRSPSKKEFDILHKYFEENEFVLVKEDSDKRTLDYRNFLGNSTSIHFKISVKLWGFGISGHKDIEIHTKVKFDNQTMKILSRLYLNLKKEKSGSCFMLPRENKKYRQFLINKFNYSANG